MIKIKKSFFNIILRYFFLFILGVPGLWLFYFIFTPLTLYPVYFLLNLFYIVNMVNATLLIDSSSRIVPIELVNACIAGSAYYFLLILNLSTPNIKFKKRFAFLGFTFLIFLILNILRIFFFSLLYLSGSSWFNFAHELFWYLVSVIFVVGIWFMGVRMFKIKDTPFYTDLKRIYKYSLFKKSP
ncbi:MAG: pacearchaeosortase [archaeon]